MHSLMMQIKFQILITELILKITNFSGSLNVLEANQNKAFKTE